MSGAVSKLHREEIELLTFVKWLEFDFLPIAGTLREREDDYGNQIDISAGNYDDLGERGKEL